MSTPKFTDRALMILDKKYYWPNERTPEDLFRRVAYNIALAEETNYKQKKYEDLFFDLMINQYFIPNTPTLKNAGNPKGLLSACLVLGPIEDSRESINRVLHEAVEAMSWGSGVGYNFSRLRPKGALIKSNGGTSSGPISFMKVFDFYVGNVIKQSAMRPGAQMGMINCDHPDLYHGDSSQNNEEIMDKHVDDFINVKRFYKEPLNPLDKDSYENIKRDLVNFNISVVTYDSFMKAVENDEDWDLKFDDKVVRTVKAREVWDAIINGAWHTGDPGMFFIDTAHRGSPMSWKYRINTTNPCITGDTLVAVADGRSTVSIQQLADEETDVPVYCLNDRGQVVIRTMRHPRLTGQKQAVYKITLDDGSSIRTTSDHKLRLKSGEYKKTKHLKAGDSLHILTKFQASFEEILETNNAKNFDYWWLNNSNFSKTFAEHRLVAAHEQNTNRLKNGLVVHHKDYNPLNNSPDNLEIMTSKQHNNHHRKNMLGDNNPMRRAKTEWAPSKWAQYSLAMSNAVSGTKNGRYSGFSNKQVVQAATELTKTLGHRFSIKEWKVFAKTKGLPQQFSQWRVESIGSVSELSKHVACRLGLDYQRTTDPRVLKTEQKAKNQGYTTKILGNAVHVERVCEFCGESFYVNYWRREQSFCSRSCHSKKMGKTYFERGKHKILAHHNKNAQTTREKQVHVFLELKQNLTREPLKQEWANECKKKGISSEIGRKTSPYRYYDDLKKNAALTNHRVVSVEFIGHEDVYNGTVDDFHNFFVGGFESETKSGKPKLTFLNNLQCGEIPLPNGGSCNLGHLNLGRYEKDGEFDFELFEEHITLAIRFLDNVVTQNQSPLEEVQNKNEGERRIGLGVMGLADLFIRLEIRYGSKESVELTEKIFKFMFRKMYDVSIELSKEKGQFPDLEGHREDFVSTPFAEEKLTDEQKEKILKQGIRNCTIGTVAPTGTTSQIFGVSGPGIEPMFALEIIRSDSFDPAADYRAPIYQEWIEKYGSDKELPDYWVTTEDVTIDEQLDLLEVMQRWVDNAISKTFNVPNEATREDVEHVYWQAWKRGLKGVTVFRDDCLVSGQVQNRKTAKKSNGEVPDRLESHRIKARFDGDNYYVNISQYKGKPYEMFINSRHEQYASWKNAVGRLASLGMKYGVPSVEIAEQLEVIEDASGQFYNGQYVGSHPALIGKILREEMQIIGEDKEESVVVEKQEPVTKDINVTEKSLTRCPQCTRKTVKKTNGCEFCTAADCTYSKCG